MRHVWIVGVSDCEANRVVAVCSTKRIAERELFKERDRLVVEWKERDGRHAEHIKEFCKEKRRRVWKDPMYLKMIKNLYSNDYEKWDNYPHECPYLYKQGVLVK